MKNLVIINKQLKDVGLKVKSIENINKGQGRIHKYLIKTQSEKYVLKISPMFDPMKLQEQMNNIRRLNETEKVSIYPIHNEPLNFENGCGYIYKFAEGIELQSRLMHQDCRIDFYDYEYGKFVGKFHKLGKNITTSSRKSIHWKQILKRVKKNLKLVKIDNLRNLYTELLQSISDILYKNFDRRISTRTQLVHKDIYPTNIIVSSQNKWTLIDMDYLSCDHVGIDLAASIWVAHATIRTNKFLLGYTSESKLTKNEVESLPLFALLRELTWINNAIKHDLSNHEKRIVFSTERLKLIKSFIKNGV